MHAPLYRAPTYLNAERVLRLYSLNVEQADAVGVIGVLLGGVPKTRRFSPGVDNHEALEEAPPEVKRDTINTLDKGKCTRYRSAEHACLPVYSSALW